MKKEDVSCTQVWKINGHLVVANDIEGALKIWRAWHAPAEPELHTVERISREDGAALIQKGEAALLTHKSSLADSFREAGAHSETEPQKTDENERVRNTAISFLKEFADKGYENAVECIDWLKGQGERMPADGVYPEKGGVRIWRNGHTFLVTKDWDKGEWPLLNKAGYERSKRSKERLMSEADALLDWDFVTATKHIQDLGTNIPLKEGEYMLTAPVWLAMYEYRDALNKALRDIGAKEIDFDKDVWFAQRYGTYYAWLFGGANRYLNRFNVYDSNQVVALSL